MNYRLTALHPNKRAFITGGGGGLGRSLALALAKDGWTIGITDIKEHALAESKRLIEKAGGKPHVYQFDVSKKDDYNKAFDDFVSKAEGLDLLINNAGVGDSGLFGEYDLEHWDWITGVNLMSAIYGSHFAVPLMKKQNSGHIISIASAAGFANMPNMSMYNVTKSGMISLMETLRAELHAHGVNVSVVCPTFFRSDIMQYRKGDAETGSIAHGIVERAKHSADEIANHVLSEAGKNRFYILPSYQAKFVFHFKRFFPILFLNYKAKQFSINDGTKWLAKTLEM